MLSYMSIKLLKTKDKEKLFKAERERDDTLPKGRKQFK